MSERAGTAPSCPPVDAAVEVAAAAARAAVLAATDRSRVDVMLKDARVDVTTSADRASQDAVVAVLRAAFPTHGVIGEDGTEPRGRDTRGTALVVRTHRLQQVCRYQKVCATDRSPAHLPQRAG